MRKRGWIGAALTLAAVPVLYLYLYLAAPGERGAGEAVVRHAPAPAAVDTGLKTLAADTVLLRARPAAQPQAASARYGIARLPDDDRADAGDAPEDHAVVEQWQPPRVQAQAGGDLLLTLARADGPRRVVAAGGGWAYYHGSLPATSAQGMVLEPRLAGGLRLGHARLPEQARIELRWAQAPPEAGWRDLLEVFAPESAADLRGPPRAVAASARWAPLPPGVPLRARLWIGIVEADQRSVTVPAGGEAELRFDEARIQAALARSGSLRLSLRSRSTQQPLSGVRVVYIGPDNMQESLSDAAGETTFDAIDLGAPLHLELHADAATGLPGFQSLQLAASELRALGPGAWAAELELASPHWLRIDLHGLPRTGDSAYPLFVLQRQTATGWTEVSDAEYRRQAAAMEVSVREAGRYRLRVAASPWHWVDSADIGVGTGGDGDTGLPLAWQDAPTARLRLLRNGAPLVGEPLRLRGAERAFPPLEGETDVGGYFALGMVSQPQAWAAVDGREWRIDLRPGDISLDLETAQPE